MCTVGGMALPSAGPSQNRDQEEGTQLEGPGMNDVKKLQVMPEGRQWCSMIGGANDRSYTGKLTGNGAARALAPVGQGGQGQASPTDLTR